VDRKFSKLPSGIEKSKVTLQISQIRDTSMAAPMQRLAEAPRRKRSPPASIEMFLVHQRSRGALASRALAPGVQALAWQDFVRAL